MKIARIITDIRPIFNDDATDIDASVISYTLRLNYDNPEGNHSLSIAMDESDIEELIQQCNRAFSKAQLSKDRMRNTAGIPTIISGEQPDE